MNIFHILQGTDLYDWDQGARVVLSRINSTQQQRNAWIPQLNDAIQAKTILWYIATLSEFDPQTGEIVQQTTWHKHGEIKNKIRLNEKARGSVSKRSMWDMPMFAAPPGEALINVEQEDDND
jgi:hypothetical protein